MSQLDPAHEDSPSRSHALGNVDSVRKRALPALRKALCSAFHPRAHSDWLVALAGRRCEVQAEQRAQFLLYPARGPEEVEPTRPRSGQPSFRDLASLRSLHSKRYFATFPGFHHALPRQLHYCRDSCLLGTRIGGPASKSSLFPFGNGDSCSLGAVCKTLGGPGSTHCRHARGGNEYVPPEKQAAGKCRGELLRCPVSPVCFPSQLPFCRDFCWLLTRVGGSADKSRLFPLEARMLVSQGLLAKP